MINDQMLRDALNLIEWLTEYVQHEPRCPVFGTNPLLKSPGCTCGLTTYLVKRDEIAATRDDKPA